MNMISSEKTYNKVSNDIKRPKKIYYVVHGVPHPKRGTRIFDLYGLHFTTKIRMMNFGQWRGKMLKARWGNIQIMKDTGMRKGKRAVYPHESKNVSEMGRENVTCIQKIKA